MRLTGLWIMLLTALSGACISFLFLTYRPEIVQSNPWGFLGWLIGFFALVILVAFAASRVGGEARRSELFDKLGG